MKARPPAGKIKPSSPCPEDATIWPGKRSEADSLRNAFLSLQQKLIETRAQCDLLVAESRRARTVGRSQQARVEKGAAALGKYKARITAQQAANHANNQLPAGDSLEDRFAMLERDQQVEALLEQLKRKELPAP
jgi:phage shock protein A